MSYNSTESKIPDAGGGSIKKIAPSLPSVQSMTTPQITQLPMQSVTPAATTQFPVQSVTSQTTQLPIQSVVTLQTTQLPTQSVNSQSTTLPIQSVATSQTTQLPMQSNSQTTQFLTQPAGAPQTTQLPIQSVATSQTAQLPVQSVNSQSTTLPIQSVATSQTTQLPMQSVNSQTTQFPTQPAGAPQTTQLPIQSVAPQNTQLHVQSVATSQTTQFTAQSVTSQINQFPVQSANTPKSNTLLPSTAASTLPVPALNNGFLKPPMQLGSRTGPPPKPGPFKSMAVTGPFRPNLFAPPGPFKPPSVPGPFKPTSVPVPFKPSASSSKAVPPRPNPFKCSSVLPAPKVAMAGAMMSRPPSLNQNHKMIPTHPTGATLMPPLPPRNNAVIMPPANQTMSARSMMCSRIPMANNHMMISAPAPSSIGQLNTSTTLKKPKKKRGRVKRSFKEFERGKAGDNGPSPKFRRIGKASKDDDKNNRKRKIKWNVEPHYTVMRKAVDLALDGQSTTRVAQEFGIPARTLRRYVATAKKANGLPETAATDRPTHAPSKKKKASLESDSGIFGSLNDLDDDYESYESDPDEDNITYGRVRSNSLDMLLAAADKSENESPSLMPQQSPSLLPHESPSLLSHKSPSLLPLKSPTLLPLKGSSLLPKASTAFAAPANASAASEQTERTSVRGAWSSEDVAPNQCRERSGSLELFFQALGTDLRNGGRRDSRGLSFDVPTMVRDQIAKSVVADASGRDRNNSLWSPTLTIVDK